MTKLAALLRLVWSAILLPAPTDLQNHSTARRTLRIGSAHELTDRASAAAQRCRTFHVIERWDVRACRNSSTTYRCLASTPRAADQTKSAVAAPRGFVDAHWYGADYCGQSRAARNHVFATPFDEFTRGLPAPSRQPLRISMILAVQFSEVARKHRRNHAHRC